MKFSNLVDHWKGLNSRILSWHSDGKLNFELMDVIDGRSSGEAVCVCVCRGGGGGGGGDFTLKTQRQWFQLPQSSRPWFLAMLTMLTRPLKTNLNEIWIKMQQFSYLKIRLILPSAKLRQFYSDLNVLTRYFVPHTFGILYVYISMNTSNKKHKSMILIPWRINITINTSILLEGTFENKKCPIE